MSINFNQLNYIINKKVVDLGAGRNNLYTSKYYKGNDWYFTWLPDSSGTDLYNGKIVHYFKLTEALGVGQLDENSVYMQFYGPPGAEDRPSQMKWTRPYFDCGKSNKWIISAVSPIVDVYPRHTEYRNIQSYMYLAVASASVDFIMMDINQCDDFNSNQDQTYISKNYFAGTHKCKRTTRVSYKFFFYKA